MAKVGQVESHLTFVSCPVFERHHRARFQRVLGHVLERAEIVHLLRGLDSVFAFVVHAALLVKHALGAQVEVLDHEGVHGLTLG